MRCTAQARPGSPRWRKPAGLDVHLCPQVAQPSPPRHCMSRERGPSGPAGASQSSTRCRIMRPAAAPGQGQRARKDSLLAELLGWCYLAPFGAGPVQGLLSNRAPIPRPTPRPHPREPGPRSATSPHRTILASRRGLRCGQRLLHDLQAPTPPCVITRRPPASPAAPGITECHRRPCGLGQAGWCDDRG